MKHASFHFNVTYNQVFAKSSADCKLNVNDVNSQQQQRQEKKQHYKSNNDTLFDTMYYTKYIQTCTLIRTIESAKGKK